MLKTPNLLPARSQKKMKTKKAERAERNSVKLGDGRGYGLGTLLWCSIIAFTC